MKWIYPQCMCIWKPRHRIYSERTLVNWTECRGGFLDQGLNVDVEDSYHWVSGAASKINHCQGQGMPANSCFTEQPDGKRTGVLFKCLFSRLVLFHSNRKTFFTYLSQTDDPRHNMKKKYMSKMSAFHFCGTNIEKLQGEYNRLSHVKVTNFTCCTLYDVHIIRSNEMCELSPTD